MPHLLFFIIGTFYISNIIQESICQNYGQKIGNYQYIYILFWN